MHGARRATLNLHYRSPDLFGLTLLSLERSGPHGSRIISIIPITTVNGQHTSQINTRPFTRFVRNQEQFLFRLLRVILSILVLLIIISTIIHLHSPIPVSFVYYIASFSSVLSSPGLFPSPPAPPRDSQSSIQCRASSAHIVHCISFISCFAWTL